HCSTSFSVSLVCTRLLRPPGSPLFPYTTLFRSQELWLSATEDVKSAHIADLNGDGLDDVVAIQRDHTVRLFSATGTWFDIRSARSEEHTSELQSRENLVCRLLLEKKKWHSGGRTKRHYLQQYIRSKQMVCHQHQFKLHRTRRKSH